MLGRTLKDFEYLRSTPGTVGENMSSLFYHSGYLFKGSNLALLWNLLLALGVLVLLLCLVKLSKPMVPLSIVSSCLFVHADLLSAVLLAGKVFHYRML